MSGLRLVAMLLAVRLVALGTAVGGCGSSGGGAGSSSSSADTTAPEVLSVSPADRAEGVSLDASVQLVFSEAMEAGSITIGTFSVSATGDDGTSNLGLSGSMSYDADTNTATFTPASNFGSDTDYTVMVSSGIRDAAGNELGADFTSSFTTSDGSGTTGGTGGTADALVEMVCGGLTGIVTNLVADSSAVYFTLNAVDTDADPGGQICRCPLSGGTANCFYDNASCHIAQLTLDSSRIYFTLAYACDSNPKQVFACTLSSTTGSCSPSTIASGNNFVYNSIASDGTYVYYGDGSENVNRIRIGTGGISQVCRTSAVDQPITMAMDASTVYFMTGLPASGNAAIRSCPKDASGSPTLLTTASGLVTEIVPAGSMLYYREIAADTTKDVKSISTAGGSATTIASGIGALGANPSLVVSGDSLYVAAGPVPGGGEDSPVGQLLKFTADGSSFEVLVNDEPVYGLAVVGDWVYFGGTEDSDSEPEPVAINRVPK